MFWLGVAEGLNQQLDRELQREIWLGKENKESASRLISARAKTMSAIIEGRKKEELELKENVRVISAFEQRLSGLESPEEREAYLNLLKQDPDYAKALLGQVEKFEADSGKGVRIENEKLVEMYDLIEQTKPSEMSREAYASDVARVAVDMAAGVKHYDSLLEGVYAEDTDTEEELAVLEQQAKGGFDSSGNLGLPQGDYSGINVDPSDEKVIGELLIAKTQAEFDRVMDAANAEVARVGGLDRLPVEDQAAYNRLRSIEQKVVNGRPEEILNYPEFSSRAYDEVAITNPAIDNTIYGVYKPAPQPAQEAVTAAPEPVAAPPPAPAAVAPAPVVPSQAPVDVMVPPPLEPPVVLGADPNQTSTLMTPPPARNGGTWRDVFSRFFA